jgi:threonylcarbamoyladenosine tRNA methylthiotransferase MtaB
VTVDARIEFLGCKVSHTDAETIADALQMAGHVVGGAARAGAAASESIGVVNACCITAQAEHKSRKQVSRLLAGADVTHVFVTGCGAANDAEQYTRIDPRVTVLPGAASLAAAAIVEAADQLAALACRGPVAGVAPGHLVSVGTAGMSVGRRHRTRGFVKVQDGCDFACSYCIVPIVRGAPTSRALDVILADVSRRAARGQREIVLTGVNVGKYRDAVSRVRLDRVLRDVAGVDGIERVRISSIEPNHVDRRLVDAIASTPEACTHLHVPLQSGDDAVLAAMGRHYDAARYARTIAGARAQLPDLNLTTDIIIGHPDETDASFQRTLCFAAEMRFTKVHAFPFSARPGTRDAERERVEPAIVADRSRQLRAQADAIAREVRSALVGEVVEVLVEERRDGRGAGYTRGYHPVELSSAAAGLDGVLMAGTIASVRIDSLDAASGSLVGVACPT